MKYLQTLCSFLSLAVLASCSSQSNAIQSIPSQHSSASQPVAEPWQFVWQQSMAGDDATALAAFTNHGRVLNPSHDVIMHLIIPQQRVGIRPVLMRQQQRAI